MGISYITLPFVALVVVTIGELPVRVPGFVVLWTCFTCLPLFFISLTTFPLFLASIFSRTRSGKCDRSHCLFKFVPWRVSRSMLDPLRGCHQNQVTYWCLGESSTRPQALSVYHYRFHKYNPKYYRGHGTSSLYRYRLF